MCCMFDIKPVSEYKSKFAHKQMKTHTDRRETPAWRREYEFKQSLAINPKTSNANVQIQNDILTSCEQKTAKQSYFIIQYICSIQRKAPEIPN